MDSPYKNIQQNKYNKINTEKYVFGYYVVTIKV